MFTVPIDIAPLLDLTADEAALLLDFADANHLSIPAAMRTLILLGLTDPVEPQRTFELPEKFFPATPVLTTTAPEGAENSKVIGP